jgi:hypothetical protein
VSGKSDTSGPQLSLGVGVTGHRDIDPAAWDAVRARVHEVFARLERELTKPIHVLSSLAEGADRVVAEIGLERGHKLVVPLPLPVEDYATDFVTPQSRAEFDELLKSAERSFVAEQLAPLPGEATRDAAYRSAGVAMARACHVLLALWDGTDNHKSGGTADIVHIKQHGERISADEAAGAEGEEARKPHGAVVRIATPRASEAAKPAVKIEWPAPRSDVWRRVQAMARRIRRFNRDAAWLGKHQPGWIAESLRHLHGPKPAPPAAVAKLDRMAALYAVADALAIQRQAWVRRGWRLLLGFGLLGLFAFGEYAHGHDHPAPWLMGYVVVIAAAVGLYWSMKWAKIQPRFLEYRALAEAMRVAFFWRVASLPGDPADRYPGHIAREVESVSMALRNEELRVDEPPPEPQGLAFAIAHWVDGQRAFFRRAARRDERWGRGLRIGADLAIGAGVLLAFAVLAAKVGPWPVAIDDHTLHQLILGMVMLPALGGALATYTDRLGHEGQARQYERMHDLFELATGELRANGQDPQRQRAILARLASEALSEHAHWVVLHRQRPFEVKMGG